MISMGHRYTLVMASLTKWALQGSDMPPEMRLEFLGHLDKMVDQVLTPAVIALVEPMDAKGWEIYQEAQKLGYGLRGPNLFDVLDKKLDLFVTLNPSLRVAYDEACRPWTKAAS
jgi:hypothetical protein